MDKKDIRIIFMGTPEFAVETLKALVENDYNVVAVVTQPDKPVGRHGSVLQPSQVKQYAVDHGLPVLQPVKMKDPEFVEQLRSYQADLQVVVAFRMLPEVVWAMPRFGTFNVHAALLPKYRGAAPINWAVINGETQTGVTTFFLDHDIDTGRIIMQRPFDIPDDADVEYVYDGLMHLGAAIALDTIDRIIAGNGHVDSIPQPSSLSSRSACQSKNSRPSTLDSQPSSLDSPLPLAPKIFKETCQVNWQQPVKRVYDFIRGLSPYPGAWTEVTNSDGYTLVLKIYKSLKTNTPANGVAGTLYTEKPHLYVNCQDFLLELLEVQLSGKKRMHARDFLNGWR
ncbi:MAG: methionyl-tRNA formyltransferase [Prevotella sp.]|nr:methionyl-tRNA formyltransferase [Prevotella sp.]